MRTSLHLPGPLLVSLFVALTAACAETPPPAAAEGTDPCKLNESVDTARLHGCVGERTPSLAAPPPGATGSGDKVPLSEKQQLREEKPMNAPPIAEPPPPRPEIQTEKVKPPPPTRGVTPPPHSIEPPSKPPPK